MSKSVACISVREWIRVCGSSNHWQYIGAFSITHKLSTSRGCWKNLSQFIDLWCKNLMQCDSNCLLHKYILSLKKKRRRRTSQQQLSQEFQWSWQHHGEKAPTVMSSPVAMRLDVPAKLSGGVKKKKNMASQWGERPIRRHMYVALCKSQTLPEALNVSCYELLQKSTFTLGDESIKVNFNVLISN